jgi:hypothetical protein
MDCAPEGDETSEGEAGCAFPLTSLSSHSPTIPGCRCAVLPLIEGIGTTNVLFCF